MTSMVKYTTVLASCLLFCCLFVVSLDGAGEQAAAGSAATNQLARHKRDTNYDCLEAHNHYRRLHKVRDLRWDNRLAAYARRRSKSMASTGRFAHEAHNKYGENLYMTMGGRTDCHAMVRAWYKEIGRYNYRSPGFSKGTGHFTQVVWRSTSRVGCAVAKSRRGTYLTCNYDPPGNFAGEFGRNVPQARGGSGSRWNEQDIDEYVDDEMELPDNSLAIDIESFMSEYLAKNTDLHEGDDEDGTTSNNSQDGDGISSSADSDSSYGCTTDQVDGKILVRCSHISHKMSFNQSVTWEETSEPSGGEMGGQSDEVVNQSKPEKSTTAAPSTDMHG